MESKSKIRLIRESDDARAQIGEWLAAPIAKQVFEALRERAIPRSIPQIDNRNHPDTIIAHKYHEMVGANNTLDWFSRLTYPLDTHPDDGAEAEEVPHAWNLPAHLRGGPPQMHIAKQ